MVDARGLMYSLGTAGAPEEGVRMSRNSTSAKAEQLVIWMALAGCISGCATRQWDPIAMAAAPTWVASLNHEQAEGEVTTRPSGSVRVVPPTVCTAGCESTL